MTFLKVGQEGHYISLFLPFPLRLSLVASWSSFYPGPSLWVSGCLREGLVALPSCWGRGGALPPYLHDVSWQQRVWVSSLYDDPGPTLDTAKLHYCSSNAVSAAHSIPVLLCLPGTPLLLLFWLFCCLLLFGARVTFSVNTPV